MPHHWQPLGPGNPSEEEHADAIREYLGHNEKYRGVAREDGRTWMLFEATTEQVEELAERGLIEAKHPCSRTLDP